MTLTPRIGSAPSASNTERVATSGATPEIPPVFSNDTWGGTWGGTWGRTWFNATALVPAVAASPAVDATQRVAEAIAPDAQTHRVATEPSGGQTARVAGSITANHTKRI